MTRIPCLSISLMLFCVHLFAAQAPVPGLTSDESKQYEAAKAAALRTPEVRGAAEQFNEARKAYREDRAKFPAERVASVGTAYRKAEKAYEAAVRQALLAKSPEIAPLLKKMDAAKTRPAAKMEGETAAEAAANVNPAMRPVKDVPGLPRVLLVGDSISIGYTPQVREKLKGKANVHRIPANGGATDVGLGKMKEWLGAGHWDVIHFNFGLHDAKYASATVTRTPLPQYAENLRTLVKQMKATGAKLVFATTTPVPKGGDLSPGRKFDSIPERNKTALQVMKEAGVAIDDLYAVALPVMEKYGRPNDVHFQPEGYELLAKAVAASIESQLPK